MKSTQTVCVWRVVHTNRGNSAGRVGPSAGPFGAALKARSDTPEGCGAGAPQPAGTAGGAGRLDVCEPSLLHTDGYPLMGKSFSAGCGRVFSGCDYRLRRDQPRWQPGSQGPVLFAWPCCACGTAGGSRRRWGSGSGLVWRDCCSSCRCRVPWPFAGVPVRGGVGTPCARGSGFSACRTFGDAGSWFPV